MRGGLLVAGTTSDAGKSLLTAGICRWLHREGVKVAPFKAQNMSNNSVVTPGGAEIGRAQALQAAACGLAPEPCMNPVLLKPGGDMTSHVVLMGEPGPTLSSSTPQAWGELTPLLRTTALEAFDDLASRFDVVICEGAGSPTEINLRANDYVNLGLATARGLPVIVVGDIDRGGVFAAFFGTLALLSPTDQALVSAFVVNKFRGSAELLEPGLEMLRSVTGRRTLGVLPWVPGLAFDAEDSLSIGAALPSAGPPVGDDVLRVAVVRLPRTSNATDVDALACEPGVLVRWTDSVGDVLDADLVVLPGTRATVADLAWLRSTGLADAVVARASAGRPVLGICGGYQLLAHSIEDDVESQAGVVPGLGLLPTRVVFLPEKVLARPVGSWQGEPVTTAYEIHHGQVSVEGGVDAHGVVVEPFLDGCSVGAVFGTTWHGALESDGFRRAFLTTVAGLAGRRFVPASGADAVSYAAIRSRTLDVLGDLVADHLDTDALRSLILDGPPAGLPFVPPGAPSLPS